MRASYVLLLLVGCAAPSPAPREPELRAAVEAWYRDLSARDWDALLAHFHPGAVLATRWTPPGAPGPELMAVSPAEFVAQAHLGPGSQPVFEEWPVGLELRRAGDLGQAWVRYRVRFGAPGALAEWEGADAMTWLLHDGRWRMVALAWGG